MNRHEQINLAVNLQGKSVIFLHEQQGSTAHKVIGYDGDGMIEIDSFPGLFHAELFTVVEKGRTHD